MKKTYLMPTTHIAEIKLQQMIAASQGAVLMEGSAEKEGEVLSRENRGFSVWDDEE